MRRLFNESYANVASDIKARTEATDETPARRLAPAERASRLKDQQLRLAGISITGQYEPGDTLIDRCISIYDSDRLQYVEWSSAVSREHELLSGTEKDASLTFDASGSLKMAKQQKAEPCSTGSEIQVRYCLVRRALAFDQSNLLDFKLLETWTEKLLQSRLEEHSPGFARTTMKQLELADRKLFCILAEKREKESSVQPRGGSWMQFSKSVPSLQKCFHCFSLDLSACQRNPKEPERQAATQVNHQPRNLGVRVEREREKQGQQWSLCTNST